MDDDSKAPGRAVPSGRLSRLGSFGKLAAGVAGGMASEGARRLAAGERPRLSDVMLTPGNAMKVANQLAHLRGAAMKLGQMISMDAGDMLPAELSAILSRLRDNATHMPPQQLQKVLAKEWGADWRRRFKRFSPRPVAAASIGQVHRAETLDGRDLAIKVQYPGVRQSIDSDVDNVATLLRVSGLLPKGLDLTPLLAEAKTQLHEEADYLREGGQMRAYRARLAEEDGFVVPELDEEFTTANTLAMSFIEGVSVESLETAPQAERDRVMARLIDLVLRELFEFGVMQTDPNFANYRYQPEGGKLVLLDFGATRAVDADTVDGYAGMLRAFLAGERDAAREAAISAGFLGRTAADRHRALIDRMIDVVLAELGKDGPFDFGDRAFVGVLSEQGMALAKDRATWHLPPAGLIFVQRKISGTALLGARLKARVDIRTMVNARLADVG